MSETGVLPIIRAGSWVRINEDAEPPLARGQNGIVIRAPINVEQGSGKKGSVSEFPHEVQDDDTKFLVRLRESGGEYEFTRDDFLAIAAFVGDLPAAVMLARAAEEEAEATDAAEKLAAEENIDLNLIEGTGADGRVTVSDVRAAMRERDAVAA